MSKPLPKIEPCAKCGCAGVSCESIYGYWVACIGTPMHSAKISKDKRAAILAWNRMQREALEKDALEPDEPETSQLSRLGMKALAMADADDKAQSMSVERMREVLSDSLASLADLRIAGPMALKEIDRLREALAELAAQASKDLAGLRMCETCDGKGTFDAPIFNDEWCIALQPTKCARCGGTGRYDERAPLARAVLRLAVEAHP